MVTIIDGKKLAQSIFEEVRSKIVFLPWMPEFIDVVVGEDNVSHHYVSVKERILTHLGIKVTVKHFPDDVGTDTVENYIKEISQLSHTSGCIVQLPLPENILREKILDSIPTDIDVDCLSTKSKKFFYDNNPKFIFPTVRAILHILDRVISSLDQKRIVIIGEGELVGRPLAHVFRTRGYLVDVVSKSKGDLEEMIQEADVVISAAGSPSIIDGSMLKNDAIVIDAGTSDEGGGLKGDTEYDSVSEVASLYAPVPGGVGPVTVAMLADNIVQAAQAKTP
jgi:methylenetetrahydrofolate dehydrogenase (NADP+) / methenyltetrahydrofolate cyclohydrolase